MEQASMTEDSGMDTSVAIDVGPPGGDGDEECGISFLRRSRTKHTDNTVCKCLEGTLISPTVHVIGFSLSHADMLYHSITKFIDTVKYKHLKFKTIHKFVVHIQKTSYIETAEVRYILHQCVQAMKAMQVKKKFDQFGVKKGLLIVELGLKRVDDYICRAGALSLLAMMMETDSFKKHLNAFPQSLLPLLVSPQAITAPNCIDHQEFGPGIEFKTHGDLLPLQLFLVEVINILSSNHALRVGLREAGALDYIRYFATPVSSIYNYEIKTRMLEAWGKLGGWAPELRSVTESSGVKGEETKTGRKRKTYEAGEAIHTRSKRAKLEVPGSNSGGDEKSENDEGGNGETIGMEEMSETADTGERIEKEKEKEKEMEKKIEEDKEKQKRKKGNEKEKGSEKEKENEEARKDAENANEQERTKMEEVVAEETGEKGEASESDDKERKKKRGRKPRTHRPVRQSSRRHKGNKYKSWSETGLA